MGTLQSSRRMRASGLVVLALFSASTLGEEDGFKSSSMAEKISHSSSSSSSVSSASSASSASLTQGSSMSAMQKSAAGAVGSSAEIVDNRLSCPRRVPWLSICRRMGRLRPVQDDPDQRRETGSGRQQLCRQEEHNPTLLQGRLTARDHVADS